MTAETEVSKEVATIEEKCGLDMSSYQDLPKPDSNGISQCDKLNDPDNSYVFVTGEDGAGDDPADNNAVVMEGSSALPESKPAALEVQETDLHAKNDKLDSLIGEGEESYKVVESGNLETRDENSTTINSSQDLKSAPDDGDRVEAPSVVVEQEGETEIREEAEVKQVADLNEKIETLAEAKIEQVEDLSVDLGINHAEVSNGELESSEKTVIEKASVQNEKSEGVVEIKEEKVEVEKISDPSPACEKNQQYQLHAPLLVAESENEEPNNLSLHVDEFGDSNKNVEISEKTVIEKVRDQNEKSEGIIEIEQEKVEDEKSLDFSAAFGKNQEYQVDAPLLVAESEKEEPNNMSLHVDEFGDSNRKIESSEKTVIEKARDQNEKSEGVVEIEQEKVEDEKILDSSPASDKNHEYQLDGPLLVAESENKESNNLSLHVDEFGDSNKSFEISDKTVMEKARGPNENSEGVVEIGQEKFEDEKILDSSPAFEKNPLLDSESENKEPNNLALYVDEFGDSNKKNEISEKSVIEKARDQSEKSEGAVEIEQEKIEDLKISDSSPACDQNQEVQLEAPSVVAESEIEEINNLSSRVDEFGDFSNEEIEISEKNVTEKARDQNEKYEGVVETEQEKIEDQKISDSSPACDQNQEVQLEAPLLVAESEIEEINNLSSRVDEFGDFSNEEIEISEKNVTEKARDQNEKSEGVIDEQEKIEDQKISDSSPACDQNQEVQLEGPLLVAESEIEEINNLSSRVDEFGDFSNEEIEISEKNVTEKARDQNEKSEGVVETEQEKIEDQKISDSSPACDQNQEVQLEAPLLVTESEIEEINNLSSCVDEFGDFSNEEIEISEKNVTEKARDQNEKSEGVVETEQEKIEDQKISDSSPACDQNQEVQLEAPLLVAESVIEEINHLSLRVDEFGDSNEEPADQTNLASNETSGGCEGSQIVVAEAVECGLQEVSTKGHNEATLAKQTVESAGTVVHKEMDPFIQADDAHVDCEVSSGKAEASSCLSAIDDSKLEPGDHDFSAISSQEMDLDVTATCKTEVFDSLGVDNEGTSDIVLEAEGGIDMGGQLSGVAGISDKNLFVQRSEDTGDSPSDTKSMASADGSSNELIAVEHASGETVTKPFNFLVRIPRFDDENLKEQISLAKLQLDEKTKLRDAIQCQIQEKRVNSQSHGVDFEYAKGEDRSARMLVRSKRKDIDALQSLISKAQNAISIEDIDSWIKNMEHRIQHETMTLKEEKLLIREIKHYKRIREELSSNMGSQEEIKQAVEQKPELEERLKILRKELDVLKDTVLKAEAAAVDAERKYEDENKVVKELQAQYKVAAEVRSAAYAQFLSLNKESNEKIRHFYKYKDAAKAARDYADKRDREALYDLCRNQVENFMKIWNTNEEFRRDYVSFNARSTVRRLGTLDGRSLGPDEEPPILPSNVSNRMVSTPAMVDSTLQNPAPELKQEAAVVENVNSNDKLMKKVTENKNQTGKNRGPSNPVNVSDEVHEEEEPLKSPEEIELARKEEERRREEIEAKLREQRRLEGLAKAKEARERKKRQLEKIQMRAELKAKKEAEQKEKEREKRLRKKERKKVGSTTTDINDGNNCETAASSEGSAEIGKEMEVKDVSLSSATTKKPKKQTVFVKQSKTKSIPPPLRNRNKKKWQQYAWVCLTSFLVLVLFWLGNIGVFSNVNLKRRSPVY